jgi:hypothetical protein
MAPGTTATPAPAGHVTPDQLERVVQQFKEKVASLEAENANMQAIVNETHAKLERAKRKAKLEAPDKYGGEKDKLTGFITQMQNYLQYYPDQFDGEGAKVTYAASRLKDKALRWFEPTLKDYLMIKTADQDDFTTKVFGSYAEFEKEITKVFGDTDEKIHAQDRLARLKQTKSCAAYATMFRQDSLRAEINEEGLMQLFYDGLKEEVKDELYQKDRPETLDEYIGMAVRIDDRMYSRKQQRKGHSTGFPKANDKKKRHQGTSYGTHSGPMDIDAAQQERHGTRSSSDTQKKRDKSDITCYNCNKKGHFKRDCRSPQKAWKPVPGKEAATIDKHTRVIEIASHEYCQEDLEDAMDRAMHYDPAESSDQDEQDEEELERKLEEMQKWAHAWDTTPPPWVQQAADLFGLALTQDEEGTWKTKDQEDQQEGPNVTFLVQRIERLKGRLEEFEDERATDKRIIERVVRQFEEVAREGRQFRAEKERARWETMTRPFEGPITYSAQGAHVGYVRNPEYEFQRAQEKEWYKVHPQEPRKYRRVRLDWDNYWKKRQYISLGDTTIDMKNEGFGHPFELQEGEATRLSPDREDHCQVPWFQCIAHECRYHYRSKFSNDHWPVRKVEHTGVRTKQQWTFDAGQAADNLLWSSNRIDHNYMRHQPKRAWPNGCGSSSVACCLSKSCILHMDSKLEDLHDNDWAVRIPRVSRTELIWARNNPQWKTVSEEWLHSFQGWDAESDSERDAFTIRQELGNDSGPSAGPVNH